VKSVGFDRQGTFWVGPARAWTPWTRKTGKVVAHVALPDPRTSASMRTARDFLDFPHLRQRLATYDRAAHQLTTISLAQKSPADGPALTGVRAMLEDDQGQLWLGSFGAGLLRYDREGQRFIRYRNNPADPESIADNSVVALFKDREGNIWTGLHGNGPITSAPGRRGLNNFALIPPTRTG
jgi:ligand-binding sensor domain-containing protein